MSGATSVFGVIARRLPEEEVTSSAFEIEEVLGADDTLPADPLRRSEYDWIWDSLTSNGLESYIDIDDLPQRGRFLLTGYMTGSYDYWGEYDEDFVVLDEIRAWWSWLARLRWYIWIWTRERARRIR